MEKNEVIEIRVRNRDEIERILDKNGLDIESACNIFLKKVMNEGGIAFLFSNTKHIDDTHPKQVTLKERKDLNHHSIQEDDPQLEVKMWKMMAVSLFKKDGFNFQDGPVSFSSKNKTTNVYWSNPNFDYLNKNWKLILNDNLNQRLHLFIIPKDSINWDALTPRNDQPEKIDLQILYGDPTYTDTRSGYSFKGFLKKTIQY